MSHRYILLALVFVITSMSCKTVPPAANMYPEVTFIEPLPVFTHNYASSKLHLRVTFQIIPDGTVNQVVIHNSSGDHQWDQNAQTALKKWRFDVHAIQDTIWIRRTIAIDIQEVVKIFVAVYEIESKNAALLVFEWMREGLSDSDLLLLAKENHIKLSIYPPSYLSLSEFSLENQRHLRALRVHDISTPISKEGMFYIFKRMPQ